MKNFKWDEAALVRERITVAIGEDQVEFQELPRKDVLDFIKVGNAIKMREPLLVEGTEEQAKDEKGELLYKWLPLENRLGDHEALIQETLAKMSSKPAKFFKDLDTGLDGLRQFVELIYALNHIDEILQTQGNLMLLPWATEKLTPTD